MHLLWLSITKVSLLKLGRNIKQTRRILQLKRKKSKRQLKKFLSELMSRSIICLLTLKCYTLCLTLVCSQLKFNSNICFYLEISKPYDAFLGFCKPFLGFHNIEGKHYIFSYNFLGNGQNENDMSQNS